MRRHARREPSRPIFPFTPPRQAPLPTRGTRERLSCVGPFCVCHARRDIQGAAENARSREKTGLKAHEGDEDLVDYYYLVMHPNTQHGLDLRRSDGKRFRLEACPKLKERFPQSFQYVPFTACLCLVRPSSHHDFPLPTERSPCCQLRCFALPGGLTGARVASPTLTTLISRSTIRIAGARRSKEAATPPLPPALSRRSLTAGGNPSHVG